MIRFAAAFAVTLVTALPFAQRAGAIEIEDVTSPAGHTAWLVEEHSIPFVSIEVVFTGGASVDPEGKAGAVSLMTSLLTEGAGDLDAQGYAAALESLAGSVSFSAGRDSVSMTIRALTENRDEVVALALSALNDAQFGQQSLDRVRAQTIASLARDQQDPDALAQLNWARLGYAGHAYATPTDGTPATVGALTLDDILDAHRAAFTADRIHVGAAGDISATELGEIVDRIAADLPQSETALPEYMTFQGAPGITVVPFDSPQSVIQFGHAGIDADDPDFMAAFVMNHIFGGGGFTSRLMSEIREARGLTYGVYTSLASFQFGDSYVGRMSTGNATAAEAIDLIRQQFEWLAADGITQEQLERTQTYLTGAYPLRFDGNDSIARILASMQFQGYDINYVNIRNDLVEAVTLEDIQRVARRLADPEALTFVVVGQPEGVESTAE
ncbi:pitrilysin family protein [Pararhodobacter sp. CCB-MM2]|uniref:M16 family metallopeptidase n=1 Tax=Pararhodobacter sp. CCB-MM2 TaxID=1786003 RepID=UPI00082A6818|nr:pitrilysin family protein [Pararhodobacter sp. CCB-MM2]MCA2012507.1 insulinase family protein [Cereibacter sphaeroides]